MRLREELTSVNAHVRKINLFFMHELLTDDLSQFLIGWAILLGRRVHFYFCILSRVCNPGLTEPENLGNPDFFETWNPDFNGLPNLELGFLNRLSTIISFLYILSSQYMIIATIMTSRRRLVGSVRKYSFSNLFVFWTLLYVSCVSHCLKLTAEALLYQNTSTTSTTSAKSTANTIIAIYMYIYISTAREANHLAMSSLPL